MEGCSMRKRVSFKEFMREVMKSAIANFKLIGRFSWVKETSWSECLKRAWEVCKCRFVIEHKVKPIKVVKVERYEFGVDISSEYGSGKYNGD
jgi:hypothetical protein